MSQMSRRFGVVHAVALVLGGCLVTGLAVRADANAAQAAKTPAVIAVVDLAKLLDGLDERAVLEQQLETGIAARRAQLEELAKQISDLRKGLEIEPQGTPVYREKVRQLLELDAQARVRREALDTISTVEKGTSLIDLYRKIAAAAESVAVREGYDAVFVDDSSMELPPQPTEPQALQIILARRLLFTADRLDITDLLRTQMNNDFAANRNKP